MRSRINQYLPIVYHEIVFRVRVSSPLSQVAVLMHETQYTYSQTQQANREKQVITFSTAGLYETQKLTVIINASAVSTPDNGEEEEGILLQWGSDRKVIVTAVDLLTNPS